MVSFDPSKPAGRSALLRFKHFTTLLHVVGALLVLATPLATAKSVGVGDSIHTPTEYHLHELDPIGRKIFGKDPSRHFCPSWSGKTRRTNYIDVCQKLGTSEGTTLCRAIGYRKVPGAEPIALLDFFTGPPHHSLRGATHPSFMTLNYVIAGEYQHISNTGARTLLTEGDLQWFSAGHDHATLPSDTATRGVQLFFSLPITMKSPSGMYSEIRSQRVPTIDWELEAGKGDCSIKLLSGSFHGQVGPLVTPTTSLILDVTVPEKSEIILPLPAFMEVYAVTLSGEARMGGDSAIDPVQAAEGAYDVGAGTFDFTRRPGHTVGSYVIANMGLSLQKTSRSHGYGALDELIVTSIVGQVRFLLIAAEPLDIPQAHGEDLTSILSRPPPVFAHSRSSPDSTDNNTPSADSQEFARQLDVLKKSRRRALESRFAGREDGWDRGLKAQQMIREDAVRKVRADRERQRANAESARLLAAAREKIAKEQAEAAVEEAARLAQVTAQAKADAEAAATTAARQPSDPSLATLDVSASIPTDEVTTPPTPPRAPRRVKLDLSGRAKVSSV